MRRHTRRLVLSVLLSLVACSTRVLWQDPKDLLPISYRSTKAPVALTVGRLRRLVIAPVRFAWIQDGKHVSQVEEQVKRELTSLTLRVLTDQKGYEAIPLELYEDIYQEKLQLSRGEVETSIAALTDWANISPDGTQPPEGLVGDVSKIGRALNVDGLMVVQGVAIPPSNAIVALTILSAGLAWPLLFAGKNNDVRMLADLYEVSTGRIVWRSRLREKDVAHLCRPACSACSARSSLQSLVPSSTNEGWISSVL